MKFIPQYYLVVLSVSLGFFVESFLFCSLQNPLDPMNTKKYMLSLLTGMVISNTAKHNAQFSKPFSPAITANYLLNWVIVEFTDQKGCRSSKQIPGGNETHGLSQVADEDVDHICPAANRQHQHQQTPKTHGHCL